MDELGNLPVGVEKPPPRSETPSPYENPSIQGANVFVRTISEEQRIRAVELRMEGLTFTEIGEQVGISQDSAQRIWKQYLKARYKQRRKDVDSEFEALLRRLERAADDAYRSYELALEKKAFATAERFLATHGRLLGDLMKYGPQYSDAGAQQARIQMAEQAVQLANVVKDAVVEAGLTDEQSERLLNAIGQRMRRFESEAERDSVWERVDSERGSRA